MLGVTESMIEIRAADPRNAESWARMRAALWPSESPADLRADIEAFLAGTSRHLVAVLLAHDESGRAVGFAELNVRPYAEGCSSDRVAFLEGWYVDPESRNRGAGRALIKAAEAWALSIGCTEFASDALLDNELGRAAHTAVGFEEVETIRCFRKPLAREQPRT